MEVYEALDTVAGAQYGLVTLPQLLQLGFGKIRVREMLATGRLLLVRQGIYRLCGSPLSWRARALAAVLAAGREAVLSHRSAGILWGLLDRQVETGEFEITRPSFARINEVHLHRHRLTSAERAVHLKIRVTTVARTLLDLGESMSDEELGVVCDEAFRRRLVTLGELRQAVDQHAGSGRRRIAPMRSVLADRGAGYMPGANPWEKEMDCMWDRMGLPPAVRQYPIRTSGHLYIPDRAIVELRIAVEWNGYERHGLRSRFDYDSKRRSELAAAGWYPLDFTAKTSPKLICTTVLAVVDERRRLFGFTA